MSALNTAARANVLVCPTVMDIAIVCQLQQQFCHALDGLELYVRAAHAASLTPLHGLRDTSTSCTSSLNPGNDPTLLLDASAVERVDTAALQLLCSVFLTAHKRAVKIQWLGVSQAFAEAARHLGVSGILELEFVPTKVIQEC